MTTLDPIPGVVEPIGGESVTSKATSKEVAVHAGLRTDRVLLIAVAMILIIGLIAQRNSHHSRRKRQ